MTENYTETIKTKLVGVTYKSRETGEPRQDLLASLKRVFEEGSNPQIYIEEFEYKDEPALAVMYYTEDIGNIKAEITADIFRRYNMPKFEVKEIEVTGGGEKNYGCNIVFDVTETLSDEIRQNRLSENQQKPETPQEETTQEETPQIVEHKQESKLIKKEIRKSPIILTIIYIISFIGFFSTEDNIFLVAAISCLPLFMASIFAIIFRITNKRKIGYLPLVPIFTFFAFAVFSLLSQI